MDGVIIVCPFRLWTYRRQNATSSIYDANQQQQQQQQQPATRLAAPHSLELMLRDERL